MIFCVLEPKTTPETGSSSTAGEVSNIDRSLFSTTPDISLAVSVGAKLNISAPGEGKVVFHCVQNIYLCILHVIEILENCF